MYASGHSHVPPPSIARSWVPKIVVALEGQGPGSDEEESPHAPPQRSRKLIQPRAFPACETPQSTCRQLPLHRLRPRPRAQWQFGVRSSPAECFYFRRVTYGCQKVWKPSFKLTVSAGGRQSPQEAAKQNAGYTGRQDGRTHAVEQPSCVVASRGRPPWGYPTGGTGATLPQGTGCVCACVCACPQPP